MTWKDLLWFRGPGHLEIYDKFGDIFDVVPPPKDWYKALDRTPLETVKVCILGQDPYPSLAHATGVAFETKASVLPPSLVNIFTEYTTDLHLPWPTSGLLTSWCKEGALLWNTSLSTKIGKPGSHKGLWESLTREVLDALCNRKPPPVFILWGMDAQTVFGARQAQSIRSPHPSPLSARRGFFGSRPFSTCNLFLKNQNQPPVNWRLP